MDATEYALRQEISELETRIVALEQKVTRLETLVEYIQSYNED